VWVADDDTVFIGNMQRAGVDLATAQTFVGQNFGINKITSGVGAGFWMVDADLTNHPRRVLCIDLDPRDNIGDLAGRIHFIFLGVFRKLSATS